MESTTQRHIWIRTEEKSADHNRGVEGYFSTTVLVIDEDSEVSRILYRFTCGDKNIGFAGQVPWKDREKVRRMVFLPK